MIYNVWFFGKDGPFIWLATVHKDRAESEATRIFKLFDEENKVVVEDINGNVIFEPQELKNENLTFGKMF